MLPAFAPHPKLNRILGAINTNDYARLQDDLELVSLKAGQLIHEAEKSVEHIYFPINCIISLVFTTQNGGSAELAIIGKEGFVGIPVLLGGHTTTYQAIAQSSGEAYRLKAEVMQWELAQCGELQDVTLRYTQALMTQMAQSVICNRYHTVDQQLCRFLLLSLDRLPDNEIHLTHELIGNMLGVRREAVTEAAGKLQAAGLIKYSRGLIKVIDRPGLEAGACECYRAVKAEYDRLFQLGNPLRSRSHTRPKVSSVHQQAEERWRQGPPDSAPAPWHDAQSVHELQVHQIELEMHNETLRQAFQEADSLRDRYADIYDFAPVSYFTLNQQGVIIDLNLAGAILLGIKGSQRSRHSFISSVAPEDAPLFKAFMAKVLEATQKTVCEIDLKATSHRPPATVRIEAIPNENADECRMVVIDVTAERQAQKALQRREQYQRAVLDNFPFMVWLKDAESHFVAVNAPFAANFACPSAEALTGKTDFDIAPREQAERFRAADQAALSSGEPSTIEEQLSIGGELRWFEIYRSPVLLADQAIGTVGFCRDITLRHMTQQALLESEQRYRSLIEQLPVSIGIIQDGLLQYINPKSTELIGYSAADCCGKTFLPLVIATDRQRALDAYEKLAVGAALACTCEIRLESKSGQIIHCQLHISTVTWEGHNAALTVFEDVTAAKAMEMELRRLARIDPLTSLSSREHFDSHLKLAHARLKRTVNQSCAMVFFGLDHLSAINTALGPLARDAALALFSALLCREIRDIDIAGRIDDEKIAVLLPDSDRTAANVFVQRLRNKTAETSINIADQCIPITISVGISAIYATDATAGEGFKRADQALKQARIMGQNQIAIAALPDTAQARQPKTNQRVPAHAKQRKDEPGQAPSAGR